MINLAIRRLEEKNDRRQTDRTAQGIVKSRLSIAGTEPTNVKFSPIREALKETIRRALDC